MSWEFADGRALAISIETRKEKGESYSALRGFFRQYELYYVVARRARRDRRARPTSAASTPTCTAAARRPSSRARSCSRTSKEINQIAEHPEWYNAFTGNCTTSIRNRVLAAGGAVPLDWRLFANGHLPELLYERGALDKSLPFDGARREERDHRAREVRRQWLEDFSQQIRAGLPRMGGAP